MLALLVNVAAVLAGGGIGLTLHKWITNRITDQLMKVMALISVAMGVSYFVKSENILVVIISLVAGTLLGGWLKLSERADALGSRNSGSSGSLLGAFLAASIIMEVGSMTIMGTMESAINGDNTVIYTKSVMDFVTMITFSVSMGPGAVLSAASVLGYQGLLFLLFTLVKDGLNPAAITEMSAVGGVILISVGFNILGVGKEKIRNFDMVPSLLIPFIWFFVKGLL